MRECGREKEGLSAREILDTQSKVREISRRVRRDVANARHPTLTTAANRGPPRV